MSRNPLADLTDLQRSFVEHYVDLAPKHGAGTEAARLAGYASESASQEASRLLKTKKIADAIAHLAKVQVSGYVLAGLKTTHDMAQGFRTVAEIDPNTGLPTGEVSTADVSAEVQLKAAASLMDRGGLIPQKDDKLTVDVQDNRSRGDLMQRMAAILGKYGFMLGPQGAEPIIDIPHRVVEDEIAEAKLERETRLLENKVAREKRAETFRNLQSTHFAKEEEEIKRNARDDARREFTEDDLEPEEWER